MPVEYSPDELFKDDPIYGHLSSDSKNKVFQTESTPHKIGRYVVDNLPMIGGLAASPLGPAGAAAGGVLGSSIKGMIQDPKGEVPASKALQDIAVDGATQGIGEGIGKLAASPKAIRSIGRMVKGHRSIFNPASGVGEEIATNAPAIAKALGPRQLGNGMIDSAIDRAGFEANDKSPQGIEAFREYMLNGPGKLEFGHEFNLPSKLQIGAGKAINRYSTPANLVRLGILGAKSTE